MTERILKRHESGPVKSIGGYVNACYLLNVASLRAEYTSLMRSAPTRAEDQPYLYDHDTGRRKAKSQQLEKLLAHQFFLRRSRLVFDGRNPIPVVDYEMPLNSARSDGLGEVDLLGVGDELCVIELKVLRPSKGADTPLNALTEAVSYSAVVQTNRTRIELEMYGHGISVPVGPVSVLVLAPHDYWGFWDTRRDRRPWRPAIDHAAGIITEATGVPIRFGSFDSTTIGPKVQVTDPLK